jgi:L-fuculose-phosphate aldolase
MVKPMVTVPADDATREARELMVAIGRRMYEAGYIAGTDGNVSVRLPNGHILTTPAGVAKGALAPADLVVTDQDGHPVGPGRPSSELKLHVAVYRLRPDVVAIVHAHPRAAVAHSLAGISLAPTVLPETVFTLGEIASADYDTPGTTTLAEGVAAVLRCHDAVVMERHGTVTLGRSLLEAYHRLESLEHTAQTLYMARTLGPFAPLPAAEVERLHEIAERSGARWPFRVDERCANAQTCERRCRPGTPARDARPVAPAGESSAPQGEESRAGSLDRGEQELVAEVVRRVLARLA